jgi:tripartite-type tricarboxylate transporter receptor subunit TctC
MYTDIIGGVLPMGFSVVSSAEQFIKSGQMKVLGVTSAKRSPVYPQWPAIAEAYPGFEAVNWAGLLAPAGVPRELAKQIGEDLLTVLNAPEVAKALLEMGIEHAPQGPVEFDAFVQSEVKRFGAVLRPLAPQK